MAFNWMSLAKMALDAYGGYKAGQERQDKADFYGKPQNYTETKVPYANDLISQLIPYILANEQNVFANRLNTYGMQAADFSPYAAALAGAQGGQPNAPVASPMPAGAAISPQPSPAPALAAQAATAAPAASGGPLALPEMNRYWEAHLNA